MKPLIILAFFLLYTGFPQISMKVLIYKCLSRTIIKGSIAFPFKLPSDISSVCLLIDPGFYILLCVSYLRPAIMSNYFRSGIAIKHRNYLFGCLNVRFIHAIPSPLH